MSALCQKRTHALHKKLLLDHLLGTVDQRGFLDVAQRSPVPMLMIYGAQTPSRSRAEMEALASVPSIRTAVLPRGKLSVHEEFPDLVAEAIKPFLSENSHAVR
jgi:pimeloyl-ACP methyl ester carboxylesterase